MNDIKKFLFDLHDFDEESLAKKRKAKAPPPPPTFSEAEIEAARAEAYQKGRIAGIDEERRSLNQKINDTVSGFQAQFASLLAQENARNTRFVDDTIALVLDALEKAFPVIYNAGKGDEMEAFLKSQITAHIKTPSIEVRVNPAMKAEIEARMDTLLTRMSLSGRWTVMPDENVPEGHCKILWASGGAEWTPMQLHRTILDFFKNQIAPDYAPYVAPDSTPVADPAPAPEAEHGVTNAETTPAPATAFDIDMRDAPAGPAAGAQVHLAKTEALSEAPIETAPAGPQPVAFEEIPTDDAAMPHASPDPEPQDEPEGMERVPHEGAMPVTEREKPPVIDVADEDHDDDDAENTDKTGKPSDYMSGLTDFGDDEPPAQ